MQNEQEQRYQEWVGKEQATSDTLTSLPMESLAATLDREHSTFAAGEPLPPLWHWLYFLDPARQSAIADDGHPHRGDFLPPIPLSRRMWAGSRLQFLRPLLVGENIERVSRIKSITLKQGRSGDLAFVCIEHDFSDSSGLVLHEEHDIVYRDAPRRNTSAANPVTAGTEFDFSLKISPDPVLLFRYSALTFNGHRIHYDRDYARKTESYPGLVVHGPLLATFILELFAKTYPDAVLTDFEFKAIKPVFDIAGFQVCGCKLDDAGSSRLWIADNAGDLCLDATARVKQP